jgi:hypothetical protein
MITKTKTGFRGRRRDSDLPYDYIGDGIMINERQKQTLAELISRNFQEEDREERLREIESITSLEAEDMIFQYLSASWNVVR